MDELKVMFSINTEKMNMKLFKKVISKKYDNKKVKSYITNMINSVESFYIKYIEDKKELYKLCDHSTVIPSATLTWLNKVFSNCLIVLRMFNMISKDYNSLEKLTNKVYKLLFYKQVLNYIINTNIIYENEKIFVTTLTIFNQN